MRRKADEVGQGKEDYLRLNVFDNKIGKLAVDYSTNTLTHISVVPHPLQLSSKALTTAFGIKIFIKLNIYNLHSIQSYPTARNPADSFTTLLEGVLVNSALT